MDLIEMFEAGSDVFIFKELFPSILLTITMCINFGNWIQCLLLIYASSTAKTNIALQSYQRAKKIIDGVVHTNVCFRVLFLAYVFINYFKSDSKVLPEENTNQWL